MRGTVVAVLLALTAPLASAQEYTIGNPAQPMASPVYVTRPVTGTVEVSNLPEVQDVRIVDGKRDGPTEVTGEVGVKATTPLPVEIMNTQKLPREVEVVGPLKLDDTQPVRVWVDNSWSPENPSGQEFAVFAYQHRFLPGDERHRRTVSVGAGRVFHLTDLVVDVRPDAQLKARLLTTPKGVGGAVAGVEFAEFPLAVVDTRRSPTLHFTTPVPVSGDFSVDVEILQANQGGYFSAVAMGYFAPRP